MRVLHAPAPARRIELRRLDAAQIAAGAERAPGAGDHERTHSSVALQLPDALRDLVTHLRVDRIALRGAVQREGGDATGDFIANGFHHGCSFSCSCRHSTLPVLDFGSSPTNSTCFGAL
jgi:hypothetical protein